MERGLVVIRLIPALLIAAIALPAAAAPADRPAVDVEAMREAMGVAAASATPESYSSPLAYHHYLEAQLAEARDDLATAIVALRTAAVFDPESAELQLSLGWLLARSGRLDQAEVTARQAIHLDPDRGEAHLLLGKVLSVRQRRLEAVAALERSIALAPSEEEAYFVLIRAVAREGDLAGAERVAKRYAAAHPTSGEAWRILANAALERGKAVATQRYLRAAVRMNPADPRSLLALAASEERNDRDGAASLLYAAVLEADPEQAEALLGLARLEVRAGRDGEARAHLRAFISSAADSALARLRAAEVFLDAERPATALEVLDEELEPGTEPRLSYSRALLLEGLGRFEEAAASYLEVPPSEGALFASAAARRADCLSLAGRHDEAIAAVDRALATAAESGEPSSTLEIVGLLPDVYRRAGRSAEAVIRLEALAAGDPATSIALARALDDAGRFDDSIRLLSQAAVDRPGEESVVFALASVRERMGDVGGAVELVQQILRSNPDHPQALNFVGYLWADQGVRLEEARRMILAALRQRPGDPAFLDSLGWCEVMRGEHRLGAAILERAARLLPADPAILHHLAEAYARLGRTSDALTTWDRAVAALDRDPDPRLRAAIEDRLRTLRRDTATHAPSSTR